MLDALKFLNMKKLKILLLFILYTLSIKSSFSQSWVEKMQDPTVNFYDVKKSFNLYFDSEKQNELRKERKREHREMEEELENEKKG